MKTKIAIWGTNPKDIYSGGRYHALMLANALVKMEAKVTYITNTIPIFFNDLNSFESNSKIDFQITEDFEQNIPINDFDIIFYIPRTGGFKSFDKNFKPFCDTNKKSKIILLNFESPNWFNSLSPTKREVSLWDTWKDVSSFAHLILSSTKESTKFAKDFYTNNSSLKFSEAYPSINSATAESIKRKKIPKGKRIFMATRFFLSDHKGSNNIEDFFCENLKNFTFTLMIGGNGISDEKKNLLTHSASLHDIKIDFQFSISDEEKFKLIAKSRCVLFPSYFEGFGYPPVEALYMNTNCVAFDIPVLRETCGSLIDYAPLGDFGILRKKLCKSVLKEESSVLHENFSFQKFTLEAYSQSLKKTLSLLIAT